MGRWMSIIVAAAVLISAAAAQNAGANAQGAAAGNASANPGSASAGLEAGTAVEASLSKSVDAKKAKPGDPVEARVQKDVKSAGHVVVPKGAKLVGHVTQAQAREKGKAESALGIAFDRAVLKNGQTIAFQGVIRSLAAAPQVAAYDQDESMASAGSSGYPASPAAAGGGLGSAAGSAVRGINSTTGGVVRDAGSVASEAAGATANTVGAAGTNVGATSAGALGANARGIRGLPGLQIDAAASSSTRGTLIVSNTRNVHLDSGTQLVIQVTTQ